LVAAVRVDLDTVRKRLPLLPGCYVWKDEAGKVLYVGKAKNLRSRVSSYFAKDVAGKTQLLMSKARDVEFIVTDTEVEALVLENTLIKKHQPPYNIELKTTVRYAYILLTDEQWPRVLTIRSRKAKGTVYGPYVSGWERIRLIKLCVDICKLRICTTMPKRPCLQYHIGKCDAPCIKNITHEDYMRNVRKARKILEGKTEQIEQELQADMDRFAKSREFEKAAEKRDQLVLLRSVLDEQKVERQRSFDQDVFATFLVDGKLKVEVFQIKRGVMAKREKYTLELLAGQHLSDFLRAYYTSHAVPREILVDADLEDQVVLEQYFGNLAGRQVDIINPKLGEKRKLVELARQNAQVDFQEEYPELAELARFLKLKSLPKVIECFDISHLGASDVVAASVQFVNGKPNPSEFRRYEIKTVAGQDDFRSIYEVVFRRYRRMKEEGQALPDLVVIDGGKVQLQFARSALQDVGVSLPVIALAKREEEIYLPYLSIPVTLPRSNAALKLLQRIRDSTHRFVLKYQRVKRSKRMVSD
jgi:excinuclease ABC subunit C